MTGNVVIQSFVLCDEVRKEEAGTAIVIGASQRGPAIPESGRDIARLSFYIEAVLTAVSEIWIKIKGGDGGEIFNQQIAVGYRGVFEEQFGDSFDFFSAAVSAQLIVNGTGIHVPSPGKYSIEISTNNIDWEKIREYDFPAAEEDKENF